MKVLIGGASGFVGKYLSRNLKNKGYEVIGVSRTPGSGKITWTDLERSGLPEKCTAVVSLSGELLMNPLRRWSESLKADLRESRIDRTKQLAKAISEASEKPKVFVSASAIGAYEASQTTVYTEDSPASSGDFMSALCQDWEAAGRLPADLGVRQATVRIGLVLGRDGGLIKNMYLPFYLGVGGRLGSGQQWFPWVHVEDVAGIFAHAIEDDSVSGVLNAVAPDPVTNATFTQELASAMWRPALFPLPGFVVNCVFGSERGSVMLSGQNVQPKRTLESGYKFIYPDVKSAVKQCVS